MDSASAAKPMSPALSLPICSLWRSQSCATAAANGGARKLIPRSSRLRFRNAQPHPPGRILTEDLLWRNAIAAETNTIRLSRFGTKEKRALSIHSSARFTCSPQSAQNAEPRSLATAWKVMEKFSAAPIARNEPASPHSKIALDSRRIVLIPSEAINVPVRWGQRTLQRSYYSPELLVEQWCGRQASRLSWPGKCLALLTSNVQAGNLNTRSGEDA